MRSSTYQRRLTIEDVVYAFAFPTFSFRATLLSSIFSTSRCLRVILIRSRVNGRQAHQVEPVVTLVIHSEGAAFGKKARYMPI